MRPGERREAPQPSPGGGSAPETPQRALAGRPDLPAALGTARGPAAATPHTDSGGRGLGPGAAGTRGRAGVSDDGGTAGGQHEDAGVPGAGGPGRGAEARVPHHAGAHGAARWPAGPGLRSRQGGKPRPAAGSGAARIGLRRRAERGAMQQLHWPAGPRGPGRAPLPGGRRARNAAGNGRRERGTGPAAARTHRSAVSPPAPGLRSELHGPAAPRLPDAPARTTPHAAARATPPPAGPQPRPRPLPAGGLAGARGGPSACSANQGPRLGLLPRDWRTPRPMKGQQAHGASAPGGGGLRRRRLSPFVLRLRWGRGIWPKTLPERPDRPDRGHPFTLSGCRAPTTVGLSFHLCSTSYLGFGGSEFCVPGF